jgi:hypothetical protein
LKNNVENGTYCFSVIKKPAKMPAFLLRMRIDAAANESCPAYMQE